jgi:hypothetical protein
VLKFIGLRKAIVRFAVRLRVAIAFRAGIAIRSRGRRRTTISFVIDANGKRVFCAKVTQCVIGGSGDEKLPNEKEISHGRVSWQTR